MLNFGLFIYIVRDVFKNRIQIQIMAIGAIEVRHAASTYLMTFRGAMIDDYGRFDDFMIHYAFIN